MKRVYSLTRLCALGQKKLITWTSLYVVLELLAILLFLQKMVSEQLTLNYIILSGSLAQLEQKLVATS